MKIALSNFYLIIIILVKNDTKNHLKKVYSALTLTLLAAAAGSIAAIQFPILANPFITLAGSLYLLFSLGMLIKITCISNLKNKEFSIIRSPYFYRIPSMQAVTFS